LDTVTSDILIVYGQAAIWFMPALSVTTQDHHISRYLGLLPPLRGSLPNH
jgi:hypothetical protein